MASFRFALDCPDDAPAGSFADRFESGPDCLPQPAGRTSGRSTWRGFLPPETVAALDASAASGAALDATANPATIEAAPDAPSVAPLLILGAALYFLSRSRSS